MEGTNPPLNMLNRDSAQAVQLVCEVLLQLQNLFLSLCNVPGSFACSFHKIWVSLCIIRDARHWAESKNMNDFSLPSLQLNVHKHRQC